LPAVLGDLSSQETLRARLETLQMQESRFRELVIRLRHGLTTNYDEANLWMRQIRANQAELAERVRTNAIEDVAGALSKRCRASGNAMERFQDAQCAGAQFAAVFSERCGQFHAQSAGRRDR
jgi:hypothetical protein